MKTKRKALVKIIQRFIRLTEKIGHGHCPGVDCSRGCDWGRFLDEARRAVGKDAGFEFDARLNQFMRKNAPPAMLGLFEKFDPAGQAIDLSPMEDYVSDPVVDMRTAMERLGLVADEVGPGIREAVAKAKAAPSQMMQAAGGPQPERFRAPSGATAGPPTFSGDPWLKFSTTGPTAAVIVDDVTGEIVRQATPEDLGERGAIVDGRVDAPIDARTEQDARILAGMHIRTDYIPDDRVPQPETPIPDVPPLFQPDVHGVTMMRCGDAMKAWGSAPIRMCEADPIEGTKACKRCGVAHHQPGEWCANCGNIARELGEGEG